MNEHTCMHLHSKSSYPPEDEDRSKRSSNFTQQVFSNQGINSITSNSFLALEFVKVSGYFDSFKRFQVTAVT